MNTTIPDNVVKELGIERLKPKQQQELIAELEELIEYRVTEDLLDTLDVDSLARFRQIMNTGIEEEKNKFFKKLVSENKSVVGRAMAQTVKEFKQATQAVGL